MAPLRLSRAAALAFSAAIALASAEAGTGARRDCPPEPDEACILREALDLIRGLPHVNRTPRLIDVAESLSKGRDKALGQAIFAEVHALIRAGDKEDRVPGLVRLAQARAKGGDAAAAHATALEIAGPRRREALVRIASARAANGDPQGAGRSLAAIERLPPSRDVGELVAIARIHLAIGDLRRARLNLHRAEGLWRSDWYKSWSTLLEIGALQRIAGASLTGRDIFLEARRALDAESGERVSDWQVLHAADVLARSSEPDEALAMNRRIKDAKLRAESLVTLATAFASTGAVDASNAALSEAFEALSGQADGNQRNKVHHQAAAIRAAAGQVDAALHHARAIHSEVLKAFALAGVARALARLGRAEEARAVIVEGLATIRAVPLRGAAEAEDRAFALMELGEAAQALERAR